MSVRGQSRHLVRAPLTSGLPSNPGHYRRLGMSQKCQCRKRASATGTAVVADQGAHTVRRNYLNFFQTSVTTLILPSLAKGAGRVV